ICCPHHSMRTYFPSRSFRLVHRRTCRNSKSPPLPANESCLSRFQTLLDCISFDRELPYPCSHGAEMESAVSALMLQLKPGELLRMRMSCPSRKWSDPPLR